MVRSWVFFKATGKPISFLLERTWPIILAVVAFLMGEFLNLTAQSKWLRPQRASPCLRRDFVVAGAGAFLCASLWIWLEGWLFGGLIFWRAAVHKAQTLFFGLFVNVIAQPKLQAWCCLPELAVLGNCSLCINHHSRRHQPRPGRSC